MININICPHCGERLDTQGLLEYGKWRLSPDGVEIDGERLKLTAAEASVLYTLAKARGKVVPARILGERFAKSRNFHGSLRVIVARVRKKLGGHCPIETVQGAGYRWRVSPVDRELSSKSLHLTA